MLGQEHSSDQDRGGADRLQEPDAAELFGHAPADQDGEAPDRQEGQEPAAGQQDSLFGPHEEGVLAADLLPGDEEGVPCVVEVAATCAETVGEGLSSAGVGKSQVDDVTERCR